MHVLKLCIILALLLTGCTSKAVGTDAPLKGAPSIAVDFAPGLEGLPNRQVITEVLTALPQGTALPYHVNGITLEYLYTSATGQTCGLISAESNHALVACKDKNWRVSPALVTSDSIFSTAP